MMEPGLLTELIHLGIVVAIAGVILVFFVDSRPR